MRDSDPSSPSAAGDPALPDLVDAYRARRDVIEAEMRELTRRRDEIRTAAEREARDIVDAARRDVQRTLTTARQQLIVLAGQVQAAMEPLQPSVVVRERSPFDIDESLPPGTLDIEAEPFDLDVLVDAHRDVHGIFEESRPELEGFQDAVQALARGTMPHLTAQDDPFGFPSEHASGVASDISAAPPAAPVAQSSSAASSRVSEPPVTRREPPAPPPAPPRPAIRVAPEPVAAPAAGPGQPAGRVVPEPVPAPGESPEQPALAAAPDTPPLPRAAIVEGTALPVARPGLLSWLRAHPAAGWVAAVLALTLLVGWWSRRSPDAGEIDAEVLALGDVLDPGDGGTDGAASVEATGAVPAVRLEARRAVWVQVTADGRPEAGRTLQPGEHHDIAHAREIEVHAGDAGALWVSVRGGPPEAFGADGRVLKRRVPVPSPVPAMPPPAARREPADATPANATAPSSAATPARAPVPTSGSGAANRADGTRAAASRPMTAASPGAAPEAQIVTAAERWFEAYYRRVPFDAFGSVQRPVVADSRPAEARLPEGLWEISREFDQVQIQVVADTAIFSARMIERGQVDAGTARHEALVSQVWVRQGGGWQLMDVRLLSEPRGR